MLQRRALRTASEKLRNRSSFSANVVYTTPGTRVNRYISRLLEARQPELEMADLNFFTLKYKQAERERKVGDQAQEWPAAWGASLDAAAHAQPFFCSPWVQRRPSQCRNGSWCPWALGKTLLVSWQPRPLPGGFLCLLVPPAPGRVLHQRRRARPRPGRLIQPRLPSDHPAVSVVPVPVSQRTMSLGVLL